MQTALVSYQALIAGKGGATVVVIMLCERGRRGGGGGGGRAVSVIRCTKTVLEKSVLCRCERMEGR